MSSPKKNTNIPIAIGNSSFLRPFGRRSSSSRSDQSPQRSVAELERHVQDLYAQVQKKDREAEIARARERRLQELGKKFWDEEWSGEGGLREFMLACSEETNVVEVEERMSKEYGELFRGGDKQNGVSNGT